MLFSQESQSTYEKLPKPSMPIYYISNSLKELLRKRFQEANLDYFQTLKGFISTCTDQTLLKNIFSFGLQLAINCMVSNDANKVDIQGIIII